MAINLLARSAGHGSGYRSYQLPKAEAGHLSIGPSHCSQPKCPSHSRPAPPLSRLCIDSIFDDQPLLHRRSGIAVSCRFDPLGGRDERGYLHVAPAQQAAHGSLLVGAVVVQPCRISSDQAAGNCGQYHYRMVKSSSDNGTVVSLRSGNMDHSRQDDILSYEF